MFSVPLGAPPSRTGDLTRKLELLARKFQITRAEHAAGRCLSVSLEFALTARRQLGVDVELVKWQVKNDPAFVDHWAVGLDGQSVLDLTRVQVDGSRKLVCEVDDYPLSYQHRRIYPASLLIGAYVAAGASNAARLSNGFMWASGTTLARFDLSAAWRDRDLQRAAAALREFGNFLSCFAFSGLSRALEQRARKLVDRLQVHADFPARTVNGGLDAPLHPNHPAGQTIVDLARYRMKRGLPKPTDANSSAMFQARASHRG